MAICCFLLAVGLFSAETAPARGPSSGGGRETSETDLPTGCTSDPSAPAALSGAASGDRVALSFDDGPSLTQTPPILTALKRLHAHATFFEEGRHVHGREALMREILAAGDEIGNHSYHHPEYPGNDELASTDRKIRAATGFEPCLFRPPYGLIDHKVEAAARRNHLQMVLWTLDSEDDHHPGTKAIEDNVLDGATPGAIVLLHDGGHHPQTVRAVPAIVSGLRGRGFRLVTVTELLGGHMTYGQMTTLGAANPRSSEPRARP